MNEISRINSQENPKSSPGCWYMSRKFKRVVFITFEHELLVRVGYKIVKTKHFSVLMDKLKKL